MSKKNITLNTFDRIIIKKILQEKEQQIGGVSGFSLYEIRTAMDVIKKVNFTDEEEEKFKVVGTLLSWEGIDSIELELTNGERTFLSSLISKRRNTWELDIRCLELAEKFEIKYTIDEDKKNNLNLTIFDRILIRNILTKLGGTIKSLDDLGEILETLKDVNVTDEDVQKFNNNQEDIKSFVFSDRQMIILKDALRNHKGYILDEKIFEFLNKFEVDIHNPNENEQENIGNVTE